MNCQTSILPFYVANAQIKLLFHSQNEETALWEWKPVRAQNIFGSLWFLMDCSSLCSEITLFSWK